MSDATGAWRERGVLVLGDGVRLPDVCLRCGNPARGHVLLRRLYWHPSALYLLLLANPVIYAIVAALVRTRLDARLPLCRSCARRRRAALALAGVLAPAGVVAALWGLLSASVVIGLVGVYVALAAGAGGVVGSRLYGVTRVESGRARLVGAHPALLLALPESEA